MRVNNHLSDGRGKRLRSEGCLVPFFPRQDTLAELGLHFKSESRMYAIAYSCWLGWDRVTGCGSVGRRFRGASVGEGRLEEVFVFGFSGPLGILLDDD